MVSLYDTTKTKIDSIRSITGVFGWNDVFEREFCVIGRFPTTRYDEARGEECDRVHVGEQHSDTCVRAQH